MNKDEQEGERARNIAIKIVDEFSDKNIPMRTGILAVAAILFAHLIQSGISKENGMEICSELWDRIKMKKEGD